MTCVDMTYVNVLLLFWSSKHKQAFQTLLDLLKMGLNLPMLAHQITLDLLKGLNLPLLARQIISYGYMVIRGLASSKRDICRKTKYNGLVLFTMNYRNRSRVYMCWEYTK